MFTRSVWVLQEELSDQCRKVHYKFLDVWCNGRLIERSPLTQITYPCGRKTETPQTWIKYA